MKIQGQHYRTLWRDPQDPGVVRAIDQTRLPHEFVIEKWTTWEDAARAIKGMHVRGAILIGAAAAFGLYLASRRAAPGEGFLPALRAAGRELKAARPTAVNLAWAVDRMLARLAQAPPTSDRVEAAWAEASAIAAEEEENCRRLGQNGLKLIADLSQKKGGQTVNVLTHCNAGWLACVDHGTATAPIYAAFDQGIKVHVWVDETRPWNQGARLTAWELGQHGVPHTLIADNVGGHLMQHGMVDLVIVGTDRTTRAGDVANKIGTYLKALAANDNQVPFYVALTHSSFDWTLRDGVREIPIEERGADEVKYIQGMVRDRLTRVLIAPEKTPAANYGFDVTPHRLVTGLITERGICPATEAGILALFPEGNTIHAE